MAAPHFGCNCVGSLWVPGSACGGTSITYCVWVTGEKCVLGVEAGRWGASRGFKES